MCPNIDLCEQIWGNRLNINPPFAAETTAIGPPNDETHKTCLNEDVANSPTTSILVNDPASTMHNDTLPDVETDVFDNENVSNALNKITTDVTSRKRRFVQNSRSAFDDLLLFDRNEMTSN